MVKQIFKLFALSLAACAVFAGTTPDASAASAKTAKGAPDMEHPFKHAYKAKPSKIVRTLDEFQTSTPGTMERKGAPTPNFTLDSHQIASYLEGPDGETWFYTSTIDAETIFHPYNPDDPSEGAWDEKLINGFEFTIYDQNFKKVGTVKSRLDLQEGESKIFQVELGTVITKNFFNSDNKYEVMVYSARNFEGEYGASQRTDVYSINGAKDENGNDKVIMSLDGYCVDASNVPQDRFTENFYITFGKDYAPDINEFDDPIEYANACGMVFRTYKKGGWGLPVLINERLIHNNNLPGDQESYPCIFTMPGGVDASGYNTPLIVYVEYDKPYWINPLGFDFITGEAVDESPTPDNSLKISVYTLDKVTESTLSEVSTTLIPIVNPEGYYCSFYGIGALDWTNDIAIDPVTHKPSRFTVCVSSDLNGKEEYTTSYRNFDNEGNLINIIAEDVDAVMMLSDLKGTNPQAVFTYLQDNAYYFSIVDIITGYELFALPQTIEGYMLRFNVDRTMMNGKMLYAFETAQYENDDEFNTIVPLIWIDEEGNLDHIDKFNLGQDIAIAQCYIDQPALDPYLFDADDEMEIMFLMKRYVGLGSETREELGIIGAENGYMLNAVPDAEKGYLASVGLMNLTTNPSLQITWRHADYNYTAEFYSLPFERFQGGDGSAENPYLISSAVQLKLIGNEPAAHYLVVRDFDATNRELTPIKNFSGTFDGGNHCISGLTITPANSSWVGMFDATSANAGATQGATVRNLTLLNPSLTVTGMQTRAGIIAGEGMKLTIDNVHVYNANINVADEFDGSLGVLAGKLTNKSEVTNSFVSGTAINAPHSETIGGLVGTMLTGSAVTASAFTGTITGASCVGGIVGTFDKDAIVADCHVNADLVAKNSVGGIVGFSQRGQVTRNVAEGNLTATEASRWEKVIGAGGIVGYLTADHSDTAAQEGGTVQEGPVVFNNIVALTSITVPEGATTAHRVVGKTSEELAANADPEEEFAKPEPGLEHNYVHDHLAIIGAEGTDLHTSTEGASIDRYSTDPEFLEGLGFKFGETTEEPWKVKGMFVALYFESSISIMPSQITVAEGDLFYVNVRVHGRTPVSEDELLGDFSFETDEQTLEMTGNYTFADNLFAIEFKALQPGVATVTINALGSTATCEVTVDEKSGIDNVAAATASAISFDGAAVSCAGAVIDIYSVSGIKVATGTDTVDTTTLPTGVYVAVANGSKLKIAVK